jgi:hypothetical protein
MIMTEILDETYVKTYSDAGYYIHGGYPEGDYVDAVDRIADNRTYTETDRPIEREEPTEEDYIEAGKILLGESSTS